MSVHVCIVCDSKISRKKKNVTQENTKVFPFKTPTQTENME